MLSYSTQSTEYVKVQVAPTINGVLADPTSDQVRMAFVVPGSAPPGSSDWLAGSWETAGTKYYARCLIGPAGTVTLAPGEYRVYLKISDDPEIPIVDCGQIEITL